MIYRSITAPLKQAKKSVLLLGPRQAGKSTLIQSLNPDLTINFADEMEFLTHSSKPDEVSRLLHLHQAKTIFIDEIQRIPQILNSVQALVDHNKSLKFYLSGSSARKLKRGGANLLPGRVLNYKLGPLVARELDYKMKTTNLVTTGSLPEIYLSSSTKEAQKLISSYAANYLREEIKAEALTRSLDSFARFLNESILSCGQFIDFSKMAKKAKISRHSVPRYFEILEDTLIGYRVLPFEPLREDQDLIRHPKFYLFDNGVYNSLLGNFVASPDRIGILAEQLVFSQLLHSSWAQDIDIQISSLRTRKGQEVDFVVKIDSQVFAIEVKTSDTLSSEDFAGLEFFKSVYPQTKGGFIFHLGQNERKVGKFWSVPWQQGLKEMGL